VLGDNQYLGHMKAAIQAELLTYRRNRNGDPWLPQYFNMDKLSQSLQIRSPISIPFVNRSILPEYCSCGGFISSLVDFPTENDVVTEFHNEISNLELNSGRKRFIPVPNDFDSGF